MGHFVRALATTGERRSAALPNVPTFAESGIRDFQATALRGVLAAGATTTLCTWPVTGRSLR